MIERERKDIPLRYSYSGKMADRPKQSNLLIFHLRRGARVAESGSLENCCPGNGTVGSIPTLSAKTY